MSDRASTLIHMVSHIGKALVSASVTGNLGSRPGPMQFTHGFPLFREGGARSLCEVQLEGVRWFG